MNTIQTSSPCSVFDNPKPSFKRQSAAVHCGRTINKVNLDTTCGPNGQSNAKLAFEKDLSGHEGIQAKQRITIADSGHTIDIEAAWDSVEYYLRDVIKVSPEHLEKAKQYLSTLTSETFQYHDDVVDRLVTLLNEQAGTDYPLMDEVCQEREHPANNRSGVLWKLGKWMIAALATQALMSRFPQASGAAIHGQSLPAKTTKPIEFTFLASSSNNNTHANLLLRDACLTKKPTRLGPGRELTVVPGEELCLHDGANDCDVKYYRVFNKPGRHKSIAITTNYGRGDLSLYVQKSDFFDINGLPTSDKPGNHECVVLKNPDTRTIMMGVRGFRQRATMVVDYDTGACRQSIRDGFTDALDSRTRGYPFKSAHLQVYVVSFADQEPNRPDLEQNLKDISEYFKHQSYDQFTVSWEAMNMRLPESAKTYTRANYRQWQERSQEILQESGIDPPKGNKLACLLYPQISDQSSTGHRSIMTIYGKESPGRLAHFMGHAMGLPHAQAIESSSKVVDPNHYLVKEYGNVFSLMGAGWPRSTVGEMNLLYKSFFGWIDPDKDVPRVNATGRYRIYAFDQGEKPDGPLGIRLRAGDENYDYWVEYRTTGPYAENTRQGVLINIQSPREGRDDRYIWDQAAYMLDMTPNSKSAIYPSWWGDDFIDAPLTLGRTYEDVMGGFKIRPHSVGGTPGTAGAYIDVDVVTREDGLVFPDKDDNQQDRG